MLDELELDLQHRFLLDMYFGQLDLLSAQTNEVLGILTNVVSENPVAKRLMQIKNIDCYCALVFLSDVR